MRALSVLIAVVVLFLLADRPVWGAPPKKRAHLHAWICPDYPDGRTESYKRGVCTR